MDWLLLALPGLGCAAMMVGMMWFMSRAMMTGQSQSSPTDGNRPEEHDEQQRELRNEVERLRAQAHERERETDQA